MTTPGPGYWRLLDSAREEYVPTAGGAMVIDLDKAREALRQLRAAADQLSDLRDRFALPSIQAPGADVVSRNAAEQANRMIFAGRYYLRRWHEDLLAGMVALEQQIAGYEAVDRASSSRA
ncbi:hypothetical protein [Pseudonocardia xishanensis]|uniref:PE family protein n=1 Tax=Pseudonocardia xishanensis TaxID=630995 RepID=A0ABP8RWB0_9PSEU